MKKAKKLLSLFLAALMLMSCFGAISASAMTMDAAEAAAAEFNATIPDHSAVYANKSAKQWNNTMTGLDKTLSAIVKGANLKGTVYSDATVNMLLPILGGLLPADTKLIGKYFSVAYAADTLEGYGVYPAIVEYLRTIETWDEFDASKAVWGVTDRASFEEAISYALAPNIGAVVSVLVGLRPQLYNDTLVPILESLHQGPFVDLATFKANATVNGSLDSYKYMAQLVNYICDFVDDVLANPVSFTCEILPELTYALGNGLYAVKNDTILKMFVGDIFASLPDGLSDIIAMVNGMIKDQGYNINLPAVDDNYLMTMGTAVAVESGRAEKNNGTVASYSVGIKGDSTMVFAAVAQYVQEVLQDQGNQIEIGRLIVSKVGPEYEDNYLEIVDAALNGTSLDVADACLSLVEDYADSVIEQEDVNPVVAFFAKIVKFFSDLAKKIIALFK